jgi:hypothetical protein
MYPLAPNFEERSLKLETRHHIFDLRPSIFEASEKN